MIQVAINEKDLPFWKRPFSFTFVIDFFTTLYITSVYTFSYNELNFISKALAFVLMALLALYALKQKTIKIDGLGICLGLFTLICLMSCLWALDISYAFSKTVTMIQILILIVLLYNYIQKEQKTEFFVSVMCVAASIFAVYTVLYFGVEEYFTGLVNGDRMGWGINNVNAIGMMSASAFLLNLWYVFYQKKRIYILTAVICLVVSLGSGSRTALIGMIFGTIALFLLKGKSQKKLISLLQCAGILIVFYLILQLPAFSVLMERIDSMIEGLTGSGRADGSSQMRFDMIELGLSAFDDNPLVGIGINNSAVITGEVGSSTYLHNNYVELLATTGIIGTVIYYLMFFVPLFKMLVPSFKQNHYAIISVVLILENLVFHFGTVQYYNKVSYFYLILFFICMRKAGAKNDTQQG